MFNSEREEVMDKPKTRARKIFPAPSKVCFRALENPLRYKISRNGQSIELTMNELAQIWLMAKEDYDSKPAR